MAAVAVGKLDPLDAWPEFFRSADEMSAFPSADADMSEFQWEEGVTEQSYQHDLESMLASSEYIAVREEADPVAPARPSSSDLEWT